MRAGQMGRQCGSLRFAPHAVLMSVFVLELHHRKENHEKSKEIRYACFCHVTAVSFHSFER
jgi:hypothetical protein